MLKHIAIAGELLVANICMGLESGFLNQNDAEIHPPVTLM